MCFSSYCLQQNMYVDICIQLIQRCVNTFCAVLKVHVHRLIWKPMFYIWHNTGFLMIRGLRKEMCFHRIFFAANAVRLVSFLFTLYSNRVYDAQGCVCRCERVVNVKTDWADSSRRMWHFPRVRFQRMRNNIRKRNFFFCSHSKQHLGQQQYINFDYHTSGSSGAESLALWIGCSPCTQEVEGSTPTGGTCPNDFSNPIDRDIRTQWALSWKIVVSEWRSVNAVSLNVGGGVRLIKPANLYMCTQNTINTTRTDARCRVCTAMVPYRWATRGTSLQELEYTHSGSSVDKLTSIAVTLPKTDRQTHNNSNE